MKNIVKNTKKKRHNNEKTSNRDLDINNVNQTWWINYVDCRHGENIE